VERSVDLLAGYANRRLNIFYVASVCQEDHEVDLRDQVFLGQ
jgi:hypothetical protein